MRIRKHANIALFSPAFRTSAILQQHVCQLNMSPWDLEPFLLLLPNGSIDPNLFCPIPEKDKDEKNEEGEVAKGKRNGVVSFSSAAGEADANGRVEKTEREEGQKEKKMGRRKAIGLKRERITNCKKTKKRKTGKKMEERVGCISEDGGDDYEPPNHLTQLKWEEGMGIGGERREERRRRKKEERGGLSPMMDFYYYSGFGPLWGKKRGDGVVENAENSMRLIPPSSSSSSSSSEYDRCKDEEDDDLDVIESESKAEKKEKKKKRVGRKKKRVKARSLKSLL